MLGATLSPCVPKYPPSSIFWVPCVAKLGEIVRQSHPLLLSGSPKIGLPFFLCNLQRILEKFNSLELLRAAVAEFPWETAQPLVESLGFMLEFS